MSQPSTDRIRVLHVDDEPDLTEVVAEFLEREDERFTVETANGVQQGLDRLAADPGFDCVVSDYDMPGSDGIEFLETVREQHPELPFLLYTGKGSEEVASDAISAGVTDYLQKGGGSHQYTVLVNRITNAVERYRSQQALARRNEELQRYERMVDSMNESACIYDAEGRFELVNDRLADWYNTTPAALEGQQSALIPQIQAEADGDPYQELLAGDREEITGVTESEFPGHGAAVLEYRLTPLVVDGSIEGAVGVARDITDRHERDRQLRVTTRRLELALEATDTGVWEWNLDTDEVWWNQALERAMGMKPGEFAGSFEAFTDRVHPEDLPAVRAELNAAIEGDSTYETEFRMTTDDGDVRWVVVRGRLLENGDDRRMVGVHHDVTERKALAAKLATTTDQYRALVENFPGGVYLYDDSLECLLAGGTGLAAVGLSPEEVEGGRPRDRYPTRIADEIESRLRDAFEGIESEFEQSYQGNHYRIRTLPVTGADGSVDRVMAVARDITERRARERKLTALHDVADELATSGSVDAVCERTITASREILEFDLSVFNIEDDGVLSVRAVSEEVPPEGMTDMPIEEGLAGRAYRTGTSLLVDDIRTSEDAKPQAAYRSAISVPVGEYGVFQAVAKTTGAFDEADLELAELLASHARSALERLDRERQLQRQNERLEEFASVVSHDLRNPLALAVGHLELAREECDSTHLDVVADAHDRMDTLTEDLLRMAREGEHVQETEPVALGAFAETCWQGLATADATLRSRTDRTIEAKPSRLKQLFENLFANAVEHGGDDVTVWVGPLDGGFYVADDGPGVPADEREAVFDAGYSTSPDGSGFGLSIVRQAAAAHGWEIRVTEGAEGGARFEITGIEVVE